MVFFDVDRAVKSRVAVVALLAAFCCAGFSSVGAGFLAGYYTLFGSPDGVGLIYRLLIKAVAFGILTGGCVGLLGKFALPRPRGEDGGAVTPIPIRWWERTGLVLALVFGAVLAFPNLNRFPSLQPDETHHLIVARNLAFYGRYASGSPEVGFNDRDPFDSVGPPVIFPVAAAFGVAGNSVPWARTVMAAYYMALLVALYGLFAPVIGRGGAILGLVMMQGAFGAVYLARTLYGEVPALFYAVVGLYFWRRALAREGVSWWGLGAGVCAGLMFFCKAISLIGLWGLLAVWLYDRITARRIRWAHVALPGVGMAGCWLAVNFILGLIHPAKGDAFIQMVSYYQQYLMFGFTSVRRTVAWLSRRPLEFVGMGAAMVVVIPRVFHRRYDPPVAALFFLAVLMGFWWVFFTPGIIPRYLFYTCAIGAMFAGGVAWDALRWARVGGHQPWRRALAGALGVTLLLGAAWRCWPEAHSVLAVDEMREQRELAAYVAALPRDTSVATTHWPVDNLMILLANRHVPLITSSTPGPDAYHVVIASERTDWQAKRPAVNGREPVRRIGEYMIVRH